MKKFKNFFDKKLRLFSVSGDDYGITISIMCDCGEDIRFSVDNHQDNKQLSKLPYINKLHCRSCNKSHTLNLSIKSD